MQGNILANKSSIDRSSTDFYPTPSNVTTALFNFLNIPKDKTIWECACGEGHMSKVISELGYDVISSDINDLGFGKTGIDYLETDHCNADWIITNPPFKLSEQFIRKSMEYHIPFAFLLKSQYWHSKKRSELFNTYRPKYVLPLTWRPDFLFGKKGGAPTMECLWTVWDSKPSDHTEYILLTR